jgi:hypothetical protein
MVELVMSAVLASEFSFWVKQRLTGSCSALRHLLHGLDTGTSSGAIDLCDGFTESVPVSDVLFGGLDGLDAAPFLTALGYDLAHFLKRMVPGAVITKRGI